MRRWLAPLTALLFVVFLTITGVARAQELQPIPPLTALVIDQTGTLSSAEVVALDAKLKTFEKTKGSQIGVLIVNTTAPEDIFSYAQRAAETYKLGRKNVGDGVLLVVAKNDRKVHVYVMRALEGAIPDLAAKRIINEQITPAFKAGQFAVGIDAATTQLSKLIDGEQLPAPQETWQNNDSGGSDLFMGLLMLTLFASLIGSNIARATSRWLVAPIAAAASSFIAFDMGAGIIAAAIGFVVLLAVVIFGKHYAQLATQRGASPFNFFFQKGTIYEKTSASLHSGRLRLGARPNLRQRHPCRQDAQPG